MRLELTLACPDVLPFEHLPALKGAFHRWTGHSPALHDAISLYSFSWLRGAKGGSGGLSFPTGAQWSISAPDPHLVRGLLAAVVSDPSLHAYGLRVTDAQLRAVPVFPAGEHLFRLLSPVFVKQQLHDEQGQPRPAEHLLYDNPAADARLTETLQHKLRQAGLSDAGVRVAFDRRYPAPKVKLFSYHDVHGRASFCPVLVTGTAEQLRFAWCVGIGHSTGIGCGALQ